jgi:predicted nucleotidyltransferase
MTQLSDFVGSKNCVRLLKYFIQKPQLETYQAEIVKETGISPNTTKKWLDLLVKNGLLEETKKGGLVLYSLTKGNPVVKYFKILVNVADAYEVVRTYPMESAEVYLFGSTARGEDNENSDVDLLVIGQIGANVQAGLKKSLMKKMGREANLVVYSRAQYSDLYRKDKAFYVSIETDKIKLC